MKRTLHLTTPHMHGPDVHELQLQLHSHNWYGSAFDGDFGILTAQAVYRAKYWLGYSKPDQTAGELLMGYLTGEKKPTILMKARTKLRLHNKPKPTQLTLGQKALRESVKYLGQKENPPGSNRIMFASLWYGIIGSWCAMAVTRWYVDAGAKAFKRGSHYAYVPYMVADAKAGRNYLTVTTNPQPGSVIAYDWPGESPGIADHTGLFEYWIDRAAGTFSAIEGNTSVGNDSNGGEVMRRERNVSLVQCFIHVSK